MKILTLIILSLLIFPSYSCEVTDIQSDLKKEFKIPSNEFKPITIKEDLNNDGKKEIFLTSKNLCGFKGCSYTLYKKEKNCFKVLGYFSGKIKVQKFSVNNFRNIEVLTPKSGVNPKGITVFTYDSMMQKYIKKGMSAW